MSIEFVLPQLGEGVDDAEVSQIYVSEGDAIQADQNVLQLETEKAVADLPCPHAGTIAEIHVAVGETIKVGQKVLTLRDGEPDEAAAESTGQREEPETDRTKETAEETAADDPTARGQKESEPKETEASSRRTPVREEEQPADESAADESAADESTADESTADESTADESTADESAAEETTDEQQQATEERRQKPTVEKGEAPAESAATDADQQELPPPAGPATRRLARKLGVDLRSVSGSASGGRITQEDVVAAHDRSATPETDEGERAPDMTRPSLPDFEKLGPVERQPLNKIARAAMKHLDMSWQAVPLVTQHDLADITQLEAARRHYLEVHGPSGPKITLTAIAIKATTTLLKQFPKFNASLDARQEQLVLKQYYHIGVAVDTQEGLLVPTIRDADQKSIVELAGELIEVAQRAREGKLSLKEMEHATFTVSNQGSIGGTAFTPLVSWPQVAILGISRARSELRMSPGGPQERLMLPLSLSYDHRVINGADAARFLAQLATELADYFQLLLRI